MFQIFLTWIWTKIHLRGHDSASDANFGEAHIWISENCLFQLSYCSLCSNRSKPMFFVSILISSKVGWKRQWLFCLYSQILLWSYLYRVRDEGWQEPISGVLIMVPSWACFFMLVVLFRQLMVVAIDGLVAEATDYINLLVNQEKPWVSDFNERRGPKGCLLRIFISRIFGISVEAASAPCLYVSSYFPVS